MSEIPQAIILEPVVSEKGTQLLRENKYVFKVSLKAGKVEIKKAVEELFKVRVENVRTMHVRSKTRKRRGRVLEKSSHWKKAIVKLKEGEAIKELGV